MSKKQTLKRIYDKLKKELIIHESALIMLEPEEIKPDLLIYLNDLQSEVFLIEVLILGENGE